MIIEVPHFASLRGKEREIVILRSDNGETWREHTLEASEEAVQDVLNESFEGEGTVFLVISCFTHYSLALTYSLPIYYKLATSSTSYLREENNLLVNEIPLYNFSNTS